MKKKLILPSLLAAAFYANAQNVGIGTTTPTEKLHVNGNIKGDTVKPNSIKMTPNAASGKVLTSDATGNASWQELSTGSGGSEGSGYGSWGGCSMSGISQYNPVADSTAAANDNFGNSVAISGNYAIVGAVNDDIGANTNQGSASIYQYTGGKWVIMQKITDAAGAVNDFFGMSVAISGNYAVVGASGDGETFAAQGSVSVYQLIGNNWSFMQKITDADGAANDHFGQGVAISGNYIIVGSPDDDNGGSVDQGSAIIYQYNGTTWVLMEKIIDASGAGDDRYGFSVSISGIYAIVGAPEDDVNANLEQGSASIYQYNGTNWVLMTKLTGTSGVAANDQFGHSVSVSGIYAMVGVYGFNLNRGTAIIYRYNGSSWVLNQQLTDPAGAPNDLFGISVCISGNYAIAGASGDFIGTSLQGSGTIYTRMGLGWQKLQFVSDPNGVQNDSFGISTAIDGATLRFLIGAQGFSSSSGKAVFGKIN